MEETMRIRGSMLLLTTIALAFILPAHAADVTGKWRAEFDSQIGPQKYTFDLKAEAEKLTGKAYFERMGQKGEAELKEGKVSGNEIFFVETASINGTDLRIEYKGKVSGDEITFTRKVGDIASYQIVAKRVKD
jgi:hypothetical protein